MKPIENLEGNRKLVKIRPAAWILGLVFALVTVFVGSWVARADDDAGAGPMGAARLSSVEGQVRLTQDGQVIAETAPVNAPLFTGTRIETGDDGKAEVQFDDGSVARISPNSALTLQAISGDGGSGTDLVLNNGLAYFELPGNDPNNPARVIFGDAITTVTGFTVLRVRMDAPPGDLAVFSGNAHLERGNSLAVDVHGGESLTPDPADPNHYNLAESIEPDSWDAWNSDRDQALSAAATEQTDASGNFVNSDNPSAAWNDLDANGNWYDVPGEGYVWSPYVAVSAGWDPYNCGHWMWTPQFGYIWVSCESWGYLPYYCGSWNFYNGFGWGWSPGMGGCMPWWRRGGYGGWNIGYGPSGYRQLPRPILRHPKGRNPMPVIAVNRGPESGPNVFPQRGRDNAVMIAGHQVAPMQRRQPAESYVRSASGFVYRPTGVSPGGRDSNQVLRNRPGAGNRQVYVPAQPSNSYVREANPEPARSYRPPNQGGGADRNTNTPAPVITQPGRIVVPPSPSRAEPNRTFTPQPQPQPQPRPEPSRPYTPPPQQQRPQPQPQPNRQFSPPPSQRNPGGARPNAGSFSQPSFGPPGGGFHGGPPAGGGGRGGGIGHR